MRIPVPLSVSLALLVYCMPPSAHAASQVIHVCIDGNGAKTYQDAPCAGQQRALATREYAVASPDPASLKRSREIGAEMDRRNRGDGRGRIAIVRSAARKSAGPSPCEAAKAKRKATLDKVGLKRNFDLLSRLDNEVWAVCKGF